MSNPDLHTWVSIIYTGMGILDRFASVATQDIRQVVDTFKENTKDALRIAVFPVATYVAGKRFQMCETAAFLNVTETPFPDKFSQDVPKDVAHVRDAMLDGLVPSPIPHTIRNPSVEEQVFAYGEYGTAIVVDVLMPMQIVVVWTMIETLLTDLWYAAMTARPRIRPIATKGKQKGSNREFYFSRVSEKNDGMHSAYIIAFNDPNINLAIADDGLKKLYILRNVIAHKAGICDDKYLSASNGLQWLPQCAEGQKVHITGQQAHNLIVEGLHAAIRVISAVDSWLVNNP